MPFLGAIDRHRPAINQLLASIVTGLIDYSLLRDETLLKKSMNGLATTYPFVDLVFTLDSEGRQLSDNITVRGQSSHEPSARGQNRSHQPYFLRLLKTPKRLLFR